MRLEPLDDLAAARAEWEALAERCANVFSTWEWADAWWRHLGDGARLLAFTCRRDDGTAAAILPLCVRRGVLGVRMAGWIGAGPADELGPVCAPADRDLAARALREVIARTRGQWDVVLLDALPAADGWPARLAAAPIHRMPSPVITLPDGGWDAYLASRSSNFRGQVRRRERRLARERQLSFRLADEPQAVAPALEEVIRLHDLRWSDGSAAFAGARRPFHHDFAQRAYARGWLRLWLLELDGRPVAGWYGFRFGGQEWFYQSGREPEHDGDAVGFVLMAHTVRAAAQDGIGTYRLLAGGEAYKARFATEHPEVERAVLAAGLRGRAYVRALAGRRVAGRARTRLSATVREIRSSGES
jgi:CelD/BcsL family acetyltransferase involved in cellulose biosynthesis